MGDIMGTDNDDFSNQIEALVFKIRTGCTQLVKLLGYGLLCVRGSSF